MSKIFIKSYIHSKSFDQLFDYKSDFNIHQSFIVDQNMSFYKSKNFIKAKKFEQNEAILPVNNNENNEYIFGTEKILNNNQSLFFFISKTNISFHDYRLNTKNKKRENPNFISLYNFNYSKKDAHIKERKRKNDLFKYNKNYYELNVGDVIKLGRVSLILTKIHLDQNKNYLDRCETNIETKLNKTKSSEIKPNNFEKNIYNDFYIIKSKHKFKKNYEKIIMNTKGDVEDNLEESKSNSEKRDICRICFSAESDINSPLLSLCKCSGDSKLIHLNCLSQWLKIKSDLINCPNNIYKKLIFNTINCEICREKFPEMAYDIINEKSYEIYNPEYFITSLNNIYHNYIVLESFELINNKKLIYIVSFDTKDKITIGRSQSSDLKISDVTISRIHSVLLRTKDNKILIKDACSKFGTLILIKKKKILINDKILSIQKGKVLLNLYVEYYKFGYMFNKFFNCIFCCFCCNKKKKENSNEDKKISCTNNNKKNTNLDDSNFNMIMINNYINPKAGNYFNYNTINKNNINIEEIIDIRYNADNNVVKVEEE